jgi:hypothetical protein
MNEEKRPARRKPRAQEKTAAETRPRDADPGLWIPPEYDHVVDYRESLASDFDVVTAEHPRSAVLGGFLLGVSVGIVLAWLIRQDGGR